MISLAPGASTPRMAHTYVVAPFAAPRVEVALCSSTCAAVVMRRSPIVFSPASVIHLRCAVGMVVPRIQICLLVLIYEICRMRLSVRRNVMPVCV